MISVFPYKISFYIFRRKWVLQILLTPSSVIALSARFKIFKFTKFWHWHKCSIPASVTKLKFSAKFISSNGRGSVKVQRMESVWSLIFEFLKLRTFIVLSCFEWIASFSSYSSVMWRISLFSIYIFFLGIW